MVAVKGYKKENKNKNKETLQGKKERQEKSQSTDFKKSFLSRKEF